MEEYIEHIEKYLRGRMSEEEEDEFKKSLMTNAHLHSYAFILANMLRM